MPADRPRISSLLVVFLALTVALHFLWEIAQAPLFSSMRELSFAQAFLVCLRATFGDVVLGSAAYLVIALASQNLRWGSQPGGGRLAAFSLVGVAATIALELHATGTGRWIYADSMPRLPLLGVGLSPVLQWIIVPSISIVALRKLTGAVEPKPCH